VKSILAISNAYRPMVEIGNIHRGQGAIEQDKGQAGPS
jgi:hypothetical protein